MLTDISLNVGGSEWVVILLLAMFLLFGAKKLPHFSKSLGKILGEYQRAKSTVQEEITKTTRGLNTSPFKFDSTTSMGTNTQSTSVQGTTTTSPEITNSAAANANDGISGPVVTEREKLEIIAKTLEIEPRGKSTEELKQLISSKMNQ